MAKNWKRAHDRLAAETLTLQMRFQDVERALDGEMAISRRRRVELDNANRNLERAVTKLHGAAENLAGHSQGYSAMVLHRDADELLPRDGVMMATKSAVGR